MTASQHTVGEGVDWRPIETAPYSTPVEIRVGDGMTFVATLEPNASLSEDGPCDQWQAVHEGEHPPCWSEGACWASNADEIQSRQPTAWRPLVEAPRSPAAEKELRAILAEAETANRVIALKHDADGSGRVKVADALQRIERLANSAILKARAGKAGA